eukprot:1478371-Rhodomonas_salina.1
MVVPGHAEGAVSAAETAQNGDGERAAGGAAVSAVPREHRRHIARPFLRALRPRFGIAQP